MSSRSFMAPGNDTSVPNRIAGEETLLRQSAVAGVQSPSGRVTLTFFTPRAARTVSTVSVATFGTAAGATPTLCRLGLYIVEADLSHTLVASVPNDTTLFAAANTVYSKTLSAPIALSPSRRYAVALIVVSAAALPTFSGAGPTASAMALTTPKIAGYLTGQTDLPSTISATLSGGAGMFYASLT